MKLSPNVTSFASLKENASSASSWLQKEELTISTTCSHPDGRHRGFKGKPNASLRFRFSS